VSGEAIPVADDWQQFWEGTRHGRLLLPWCLRCDAPFWYPRGACPSCLAPTIAYREAEGEGVILAVAVSRGDAPSGRDASHRAEASPESQAVGFVELTEGTRMIAAVESKNPVVPLSVGQRVSLAWRPLDDGRQFPYFEVVEP